jgi:site-specific recombinase XerC
VVRPRNTGRPLSATRVSGLCNQHLHAVGADVTLHQLRHFFATSLYRASKDIRLTQEALGHASPATTAIYAGYDQSATAGYLHAIAARVDASVAAAAS